MSGVLVISSNAFAQSIDEITDRINKYAEALENDAAHYESNYRGEAESLFRWRLGWEFLIDVSDQAFALRVAKERIDSAAVRSQILLDYAARRHEDPPAPEVAYVHGMAIADLATAESILRVLEQRTLPACDHKGVLRVVSGFPTDSVLMRKSPNVAIYPVVQSDPILRLNFAIGLDGKIGVAPAPYQDEAQGRGKVAVPAIASTVSYALVLEVLGPQAWAPATAIATFVYLLADHGQQQYKQGKLADSVKRMNTAIMRIEAAQDAGFLHIDGSRSLIGTEMCKASFSSALGRLESLAKQANNSLNQVKADLRNATEQLRPSSDADDWTKVECEIFRCPDSTGYFTWKLEELTSEIQSRNESN